MSYDQESFLEAARPLIKWMAENVHPHHVAHVDATSAELFEGQINVRDESFIKG